MSEWNIERLVPRLTEDIDIRLPEDAPYGRESKFTWKGKEVTFIRDRHMMMGDDGICVYIHYWRIKNG